MHISGPLRAARRRGGEMRKQGFPWREAIAKLAPKPMSLNEIKEWRTKEAAAGRPSSYEDFCRAQGLCVTCLGNGVTYNENRIGFKGVGMDGDTQLFERCPACNGTGKAPQES